MRACVVSAGRRELVLLWTYREVKVVEFCLRLGRQHVATSHHLTSSLSSFLSRGRKGDPRNRI